MKVSVITAVYNVVDYIDRLLNSLESQTYKDWEFIAVDGQSTDGTYEKLLEFRDKYPSKVEVIRSPHRKAGISFDRNLGLEISSGRFIAFIDGDDWWAPSFLDDTISYINHYDAVFTGHYDVLERTGKHVKAFYKKFGEVSWKEIVRGDSRFRIGNTLLRRRIIDRINLRFPEGINFSEDTYFMMIYTSQIRKVYGIDKYDFFHLIRKNSLVRSNVSLEVSTRKIETVILADKKICEDVRRYGKVDPEEFCRIFNSSSHPGSVILYIISASDTFGRKIGRQLFKRYWTELIKFKPSLSHSSILFIIWTVDLFVPGVRGLLKKIIE